MKTFCIRPLSLVLIALLSGAAALRAADALTTADDVTLFTSEKMTTYKTWSADYRQSMDMMGTKMNMNGKMSFQQPSSMRMSADIFVMGTTNQMLIVQGPNKIMWQETHTMGQHQVLKTDLNKIPTNSPAAGAMSDQMMTPQEQWKKSRKMCDYTLVGAETLNGQPVYVLEGVIKKDAKLNGKQAGMVKMMGKNRVYIGKNDGFFHKTEQFDKENATVIMTMEFSNIKFNPTLAADIFKYEPPKNVRVVEMKQMDVPVDEPAPAPVKEPATPTPSIKPSAPAHP